MTSADPDAMPAEEGATHGGRRPAAVQLGDFALAQAIARAVREVPGVADVGGGLMPAATYGPGGRVSGVVLRRAAEGTLTVEVHVVVAHAALATLGRASAATVPALYQLADQIRAAVVQEVRALALPAPAAIDVALDDLR